MDKRLPAGEAAAALARHWLGQAAGSARLLERGGGPEDLHDFRTSLRRLRVVLSAYRDVLGPAGARPLREGLRKLSHLTSPARDAQVWSAWLKRHGAPCEITRRLIIHLGAVAEHCRQEFLDQGLPGFKSAARELELRLDKVKPGKSSFHEAARHAIRAAAKRLDRRMEPVRKRGTPVQMHLARIRIKRLRYLLEPFSRSDSEVRKLVRQLRELQDRFGELHDMHELMTCGVPPASEPARIEARRLEARMRRDWLRAGKDRRLVNSARRWV
jgi:CHAD domain-containing protein